MPALLLTGHSITGWLLHLVVGSLVWHLIWRLVWGHPLAAVVVLALALALLLLRHRRRVT